MIKHNLCFSHYSANFSANSLRRLLKPYYSRHRLGHLINNIRAVFLWPWNEKARTKQKQLTNGKRTIWLFYRTDTNARVFWLPANARLKNLHAWELSRNQSTLRFDAILQHDWPIKQCLLYITVFWRENEEATFWSFYPLTDKRNSEHLPKPFFKVIRKSLYAD